MDGWMKGWMRGCWLDERWMDGRVSAQLLNGKLWMHGCMDAWRWIRKDRWMDAGMDGWIHEWIDDFLPR